MRAATSPDVPSPAAFPREWLTGRVVDHRLFEKEGRDDLFMLGVLLSDGSNLHLLAYPGGQRLSRLSPDTGYALEERYEGDDPPAGDVQAVQSLWKLLIEVTVDSGRQADAELARMGQPDKRTWKR